MQRIPEPELMSDSEQARAYACADFNEPHSMFIEKFVECFPNEDVSGDVLDLGCGPADISIRFARVFPGCIVHGVDGAQAMLDEGIKAIAHAGLSERVQLVQGVIPELKLQKLSYETIISNSLLHHLHRPETLWGCIKHYSVPGTKVFVMDLIRPEAKDDAKRLVEMYSGDEPAILKQDFFNSLCAAFRPEEVASQLNNTGLGGLRLSVISDRHMIIYGTL